MDAALHHILGPDHHAPGVGVNGPQESVVVPLLVVLVLLAFVANVLVVVHGICLVHVGQRAPGSCCDGSEARTS